MVWAMITEFVQSYKNQIAGKYDTNRRNRQAAPGQIAGAQSNQLSAGSKVKMQFYGLYADFETFNAT